MNKIINKLLPHKTTPKDVFLYLLMFAMLYTSVISSITMIFQYVNILVADPLDYYGRSYIFQTVNMASASLLISFPVFLYISRLIYREIQETSAKEKIKLRHWLIYLTLFITAITIIIDLITLIFNFFSGELTGRFILKVLTILIITTAIFLYYKKELKPIDFQSRIRKIAAVAGAAFTITIIILGFVIVGTPGYQRKVKIDEQIVNNLENLQTQIFYYWKRINALPENLEVLNKETGYNQYHHPITKKAFIYEKADASNFRLCADFSTSTISENPNAPREPVSLYYDDKMAIYGNWDHLAGYQCFDREIDPQYIEDYL